LTSDDPVVFLLALFEWHDEEDIPGFREDLLRFMAQCEELSYQFIDFIAEALGLEKDALRIFFDPVMEHRVKVRVQLWPLVGGY
jgi:isopenicillin N synthase-like dioxygenase